MRARVAPLLLMLLAQSLASFRFCRAVSTLPASSIASPATHATPSCPASARQLSSQTLTMSNLKYPAPIVLPAKTKHTASVIMLHGLGDTGAGWADLGPQFQGLLPHVKFSFPTAPTRPITLNMGMAMPGWYDIYSLDGIDMKEDEAGLLESKRYLEELVEAEVAAGIPSKRIVIAGFSQGGATALLMLRSKLQVAGVIGLSSYMPLRNQDPIISEENKGTPVLMCHGDADQVVAYKYGKQTAEKLKGMGAPIEFKTYPGMGHSACPTELQDIGKFLATKLAAE